MQTISSDYSQPPITSHLDHTITSKNHTLSNTPIHQDKQHENTIESQNSQEHGQKISSLKPQYYETLLYKQHFNISDLSNVRQFSSGSSKSLLDKVYLNFHKFDEFDSAFTRVAQTISKCSSMIKQLSLGFEGNSFFSRCRIKDLNIQTLAQILSKPLGPLQVLRLNIADSYDISDDGIKILSSSFRIVFPLLVRLELKLSSLDSLSPAGLKNLLTSFAKLTPSLRSLYFDFYYCHIFNTVAMKTLTKSLSHISKTLTDLTLKFVKCEAISDLGFQILSDFLSSPVPCLTRLELALDLCANMRSNGIKDLSKAFSKFSPQLNSLNFSLSGCEAMSDDLMKTFSTAISKKFFISLSLDFSSCSSLTDIGIMFLLEALKSSSHSLRNFKLSLGRKYAVGDESIEALCSYLDFISETVETIWVNFMQCKLISDVGVGYLIGLFSKDMFGSLEKIELDFSYCDSISWNSIKELRRCFEQESYVGKECTVEYLILKRE